MKRRSLLPRIRARAHRAARSTNDIDLVKFSSHRVWRSPSPRRNFQSRFGGRYNTVRAPGGVVRRSTFYYFVIYIYRKTTVPRAEGVHLTSSEMISPDLNGFACVGSQ